MKTKSPKRAKLTNTKKIYTYNVICSFQTQYSFTESEVEPDRGGDEGNFEPTEKALDRLCKEFTEYIGCNYGIDKFQAFADSDDLLGVDEDLPPKAKFRAERKNNL